MITWLAEYTCFQNFKQYLDSEHSSNTMIGKTKLKRAHIETRLIQQCTWVQGNIYSRAFTVDLQDWFETNITCINTHALSWLANRSTVNIFMYSWMLLVEDINEHYYVFLADIDTKCVFCPTQKYFKSSQWYMQHMEIIFPRYYTFLNTKQFTCKISGH